MCVFVCVFLSIFFIRQTELTYLEHIDINIQPLGLFMVVGGLEHQQVGVVLHVFFHKGALYCSVSSLFDVGGIGGAGMIQY